MSRWMNDIVKSRGVRNAGVVVALLVVGVVVWRVMAGGARKPPSIFDSPVENVASFLGDAGFKALSIDERMAYLKGLVERFGSMSQSDSVAASAFFAGLTGDAAEAVMNNMRDLGKDILVDGADGYLKCTDDAEREA
ncbi:MAG TPA: hypothetical protein VG711_02785, partial [Phycisphaerales bacterium]|nr:hypothetical protein [Phycisphaerales bacterium]